MKIDVEKLVFTELGEDDDATETWFVAESPIATYYIDRRKNEQEYVSYTVNETIGRDASLIEAIKRVNAYHVGLIFKCLIWQ